MLDDIQHQRALNLCIRAQACNITGDRVNASLMLEELRIILE